MNVGFISLGCSKNLIDTEVAIGKFKSHHFQIVNDPKQAIFFVPIFPQFLALKTITIIKR